MVKCVSLADETGWSNVNWHSIKGRLARATAGERGQLDECRCPLRRMSRNRLDHDGVRE
jgi:hypothetical protein